MYAFIHFFSEMNYKFKTETINCKNKTITLVLNYLRSISIHQRVVTGGLKKHGSGETG